LTKKAPYKGLGADSEEKHEPVSDIDTVVVDSLKALDPKRPIREADASNRRVDIPRELRQADDSDDRIAEMLERLSKGAAA
jgi:hypothetical protein